MNLPFCIERTDPGKILTSGLRCKTISINHVEATSSDSPFFDPWVTKFVPPERPIAQPHAHDKFVDVSVPNRSISKTQDQAYTHVVRI
jgi:hypothetical protein